MKKPQNEVNNNQLSVTDLQSEKNFMGQSEFLKSVISRTIFPASKQGYQFGLQKLERPSLPKLAKQIPPPGSYDPIIDSVRKKSPSIAKNSEPRFDLQMNKRKIEQSQVSP